MFCSNLEDPQTPLLVKASAVGEAPDGEDSGGGAVVKPVGPGPHIEMTLQSHTGARLKRESDIRTFRGKWTEH